MLFNKNPAYINTERKYVDTNQLFHIIVEHLSQYRQIHFFYIYNEKEENPFHIVTKYASVMGGSLYLLLYLLIKTSILSTCYYPLFSPSASYCQLIFSQGCPRAASGAATDKEMTKKAKTPQGRLDLPEKKNDVLEGEDKTMVVCVYLTPTS